MTTAIKNASRAIGCEKCFSEHSFCKTSYDALLIGGAVYRFVFVQVINTCSIIRPFQGRGARVDVLRRGTPLRCYIMPLQGMASCHMAIVAKYAMDLKPRRGDIY